MSAIPPDADIERWTYDVRFVPTQRKSTTSFDHLVGAGNQCRWHFETKCHRSFEVAGPRLCDISKMALLSHFLPCLDAARCRQ
jgi:hypothetical protein